MFEEKCNLSIETTENVMEFSSDYDQITTSERLKWRKLHKFLFEFILVVVKYCSFVLILYKLTVLQIIIIRIYDTFHGFPIFLHKRLPKGISICAACSFQHVLEFGL